jgi:hypothetical protein
MAGYCEFSVTVTGPQESLRQLVELLMPNDEEDESTPGHRGYDDDLIDDKLLIRPTTPESEQKGDEFHV